jgi:hypothetical protein
LEYASGVGAVTGFYDPSEVLAGLKDFQQDTVDYVFERMYGDADPASRFLVADEVGLGKTLVARGLVARAVRHLQQKKIKRIDVVYVCSNADIAEQNIRRLKLPGFHSFTRATRLTMLPLELHNLTKNELNFVAFTPGTSFNLRSSMGRVEERALLHVLLDKIWGTRAVTSSGAYRVLQGGVQRLDSFKWYINRISGRPIDHTLLRQFAEAIEADDARAHAAGNPGLQDRFDDLSVRFRYPRKNRPEQDLRERSRVIGEFRQLLAATCIDALEPDLVILDEFQRFRNLLDDDSTSAELARGLFDYPDVRTLMLSATPYKMYSVSDESEEDHYRDFLRTARFLMGDDADGFSEDLEKFRTALFHIADPDRPDAVAAKTAIEDRLRKVMVRTERLAVSTDRGGMLRERQSANVVLRPTDLKAYLATEHISRVLHAGTAVEYWKSAPYLLNFMDGYKLNREFDKIDRRTSEWRQIQPVLESGDGLLDWDDYMSYAAIDPENARLRSLITEMVDSGLWQLLWLPPSLPYYELGGPFRDLSTTDLTKRLVFSAWNVVPKVIASLTSYEAERRMMTIDNNHAENSPQARKRIKPLLQVKRAGDDFSGLSALTLLYPSPSLARLGDPREIARTHSPSGRIITRDTLLSAVRERIKVAMAPLVLDTPTDGKEDERWYWVAPLLLDHRVGQMEPWFEQPELADVWSGADETETEAGEGDQTAFAEALAHARNLATSFEEAASNGGPRPLGRVPTDLDEVLAEVAVGAPGNAALRAISLVTGGTQLYANSAVRNAAASTAWSFRKLFNLTDVMALVRGLDGKGPYWRQVLRYSINGDLQASLDEYAHVLRDWLGIVDGDGSTSAVKIALEMQNAIGLRSALYTARDVSTDGNTNTEYRLRSRFATRFGSDRSDEENELRRASSVRGAFNSPFWPFVLATTSIGQEGLDFHLYCHAVVHWNLPANPVDLEQREGRIHRYKGHAVRKNVARAYRKVALGSDGDPWAAAFQAAVEGRPPSENDLVPYWLFPLDNGSTIDRYVPALPLTREISRLEMLKRSLALYRLVFGQPRQEDLVEYLLAKGLSRDEIGDLVTDLRIDLTPR